MYQALDVRLGLPRKKKRLPPARSVDGAGRGVLLEVSRRAVVRNAASKNRMRLSNSSD